MQAPTKSPLFILMGLVFVFSLSMDIYLPALPEIQRLMQTTPLGVQMTMTIPMLVMSLGLCVLGWFCDRFGRKKIALIFSLLFVIGSIFCAQSTSIQELYFGRFLQALGASGMYVAAFSMAKDQSLSIYESSRTFGLMHACCALSPLLAPLIGSLIISSFNWRWTFYTLLWFGILMIVALALFGKETLKKQTKRPLGLSTYKHVLKKKSFLAYVLPSTSGMVCIFTYFSLSPFILINQLGIDEAQFGLYFGYIVIGFVIGCFVNSKLSYRFGLKNISSLGSILLLVSGLALVIPLYFISPHIHLYIIALIPSGFGSALLLSASTAAALSELDETAGTGVAVLGLFQYSISALIGSTAMYFLSNSWLPMGWALIIISFFGVMPLLIRPKIDLSHAPCSK